MVSHNQVTLDYSWLEPTILWTSLCSYKRKQHNNEMPLLL